MKNEMKFYRVVKDAESIFNNRPLQYVEDELGPRVLTPNCIIHGREVYTLEGDEIEDSPSKMEKRLRRAKMRCGKDGAQSILEH